MCGQLTLEIQTPLQCGQVEKLKHLHVWKGIWKEKYDNTDDVYIVKLSF